jgi:hypothetical protein
MRRRSAHLGTSLRFLAALALVTASFATSGCAAAFRSGKVPVTVQTEPAGAEVRMNNGLPRATPSEVQVARNGTVQLTLSKVGYEDHRGLVKKSLNPGWLTIDIATCVFLVGLCIPLLVDAVTGAWYDVPPEYSARLQPLGASAAVPAGTAPPVASAGTLVPAQPPAAVGVPGAPAIPATAPPASMSESERKSSARAAFQEGVALLDKSPAEALGKFQAAQKLFDAPTHVFRIGQCLALMGKLVEAQEVYEVLTRRDIPANAPDAFKDAQEQGRKELEKVRGRIPTLRIVVVPAPASVQNLVLSVNGAVMPIELVGVARPVNPGTYRVSATARDLKTAPVELKVEESTQKSIELKLSR